MYPFRVAGRTIEVCKYRVDYTLTIPPDEETEETETRQKERSRLFQTQDAAEAFAGRMDGTVVENDTTAYNWMDGLNIPADAKCPMDAAVQMAEMGQAAYEAWQASVKASDPVQNRADLDYMSLILGVDL